MPRIAVTIPNAPVPAGPYSHGVVAGGFLFTAGFGPQDPTTGQVVPGGVYEQTQQVLRNIQNVLATSGATMDDVVKVTAHLEHLDEDFAEYNRAYAEFFTAPYPVRTTVGSHLANILVEIDVVASLPESGARA
ncbi:MAG: RidA family protein [Microbacterium sp.]|uniref:RidA family protein n=1 Tax=Microbacterium sp. TaxID=51671 RepID=UPI001AC63B14|nr:Rid family hydrolase [Microbacterium sp.]MBN9176173.1 RidA family protein [Microbacterium sp.]